MTTATNKPTRLAESIAIEKGIKARATAALSALHHNAEKAPLYNGHNKTYQPSVEGGDTVPPETALVQQTAQSVLAQPALIQTELFDIEMTKDRANCLATADVVVDGTTVVANAPVTYLLFLEKQLTDMRTFVEKMPTLDPSVTWTLDPNTDMFTTTPAQTQRTKKEPRVITKSEALIKDGVGLPAQVEVIYEDKVIGSYSLVKNSGALPGPRKAALLARADKLLQAVKIAREQANALECWRANVGAGLFGFLFA